MCAHTRMDYATTGIETQIRRSWRLDSCISNRLHPNNLASTDHLPGPTSAVAAETMPTTTPHSRNSGCRYASTSAASARTAPVIGIHRPTTTIALKLRWRIEAAREVDERPLFSIPIPYIPAAPPIARRMRSRPTPGRPMANVEYNLRTAGTRLYNFGGGREALNGPVGTHFWWML
jgi:hypothetical protein